MIFNDDREQAAAYGAKAMDAMAQNGIPATPSNYAIWYVYNSGSHPDLRRDLNILISNKQEFTPERNYEVYDRHFGETAQTHALSETSERIENAVAQLATLMGEAGENTAGYGEQLQSYSGQLAGSSTAEEVRSTIAGILEETRKMAEQHKKLEGNLQNSQQEIKNLRNDISSIRQEALTDALTGIANRKCFDDRMRMYVQEAMETGEPMCLLMLDIDHFKKFNDTYGHQLGDEVLKLVARTFTENVKGRDLPARYGGEEFSILLPQTALENTLVVAEQIRSTVERRRIVNRNNGQTLGAITLSVGAAQYRLGEPVATMLKRADEALYRAKRDGRNRVCAEDPEDVPEAAPVAAPAAAAS